MRKTAISAAFFLLFTGSAFADQVTITNATEGTIYRIYAWPTELIVRNYNVLGFPMNRKETKTINVDNSYQNCMFTFQFDQNNPLDLKNLNYVRKPLIQVDVNLCTIKGAFAIQHGPL